jgi:hypothetical protein
VCHRLTNGNRLDLVKTAHNPFELEDHGERHEKGRRLEYDAAGNGPLPRSLRVIGVLAVKSRQNIRVDRDHVFVRCRLSRSAASKPDSLRAPDLEGFTFTRPKPAAGSDAGTRRSAVVYSERLRRRHQKVPSQPTRGKGPIQDAGKQGTGRTTGETAAVKANPATGRGSYADPLGYPTHGVDPFGRADAVSAMASRWRV